MLHSQPQSAVRDSLHHGKHQAVSFLQSQLAVLSYQHVIAIVSSTTSTTAQLKHILMTQLAKWHCHVYRLAKSQTELANGNLDTPPASDNEVLPGPPPQPNAQQPWLPQSAPAAHPIGAHPMHSAPPGAAYQGYGAEYYFQHPGGYPVSHLHPAAVKPAAEDDRYALTQNL